MQIILTRYVLLIAVVLTACSCSSNPTLRFFSYWGNDFDLNSNFSNLNFKIGDVDQIKKFYPLGIKTFLPIESDFITSDANGSFILKSNYKENWQKTVATVTPLI